MSRGAWAWPHYVATWFRNNGFQVCEERYTARPEEARPDLWLHDLAGGVEVVPMLEPFTSRADFPHASVAIVTDDALRRSAASRHKRLACVIVSVPSGAMVCTAWKPETWTENGDSWYAPREALRDMRAFAALERALQHP